MIIKDPSTGRTASVDSYGRLSTRSTIRDEDVFFTTNGDCYVSSTQHITLTTATESAVYFLKSKVDNLLSLKYLRIDSSASTGGTGTGEVKIYRNPTSGTIITAETPMNAVLNRNFATSKTADVIQYSGFQGATIVGPESALVDIFIPATDVQYPFEFLIGKDNCIAVSIKPPAGNTSMIVAVKTVYSITDITLGGLYGG